MNGKQNGGEPAKAVPPEAVDKPPPTKMEYEAWLAEIRVLYGKTNEAVLAVGRRFKEIREEIGRHFEAFISIYVEKATGLGWSKSQVYRMIAAFDTWNGNEYLDRFDRSALYSLSPRWPNRGKPTEQHKQKAALVGVARKACLDRAKKHQFVTNKIAVQELVKAGAKASPDAGSKTAIKTTKKSWNATANKRGLDPEQVVAMLKDLGYAIKFTDVPAGKKENAA